MTGMCQRDWRPETHGWAGCAGQLLWGIIVAGAALVAYWIAQRLYWWVVA